MAMDEACKDIAWIRQLLTDMFSRPNGPTRLGTDSQSAIAWIKNSEYHPRTRHISLRYHYVREQEQLGNVVTHHVPTGEMPADMLTKSLSEPKLKFCRLKVGLYSDTHNEVSE